MNIGSYVRQSRGACAFTVWAPRCGSMELVLRAPSQRVVHMKRDKCGYWRADVENVLPGAKYFYRLDNVKDRPDPASRFQPEGVHGPSQVVDHRLFAWDDGEWKGPALDDFILYELHVGTFTPEGTFEAIIPQLDYLRDLGVTALELMPVAQFPGTRNWGYDGVYPYAVQNSYGGPEGLKRLVNACHRKGLAVVLDVVYNHLGPEGNYLWDYGPYFTDKYKTPWGDAINFDGPWSDDVRRYFIDSALAWIVDYHIDALRIDAIHGIFDFSAKHFLRELGEAVHAQAEILGRKVYVIPESDLNDVRVINSVDADGFGLDAQWNDDFHHALHTLLTSEHDGYYADFGRVGHLEKAFCEGFVYSGQYSAFRKRRHGSPSRERPARQFVVFSQNHDQVGNRMLGDRPSASLSLDQLKLAAGVVLLSPFIPLLFMGEEYGETAPFLYFISHSDKDLVEAVRRGRKEEFAHFGWRGEVPDPQDEAVFLKSKIDLELRHRDEQRPLYEFYKRLVLLRKETPVLRNLDKKNMETRVFEAEKALFIRRWLEREELFCLFNFSGKEEAVSVALPAGGWRRMLSSAEREGDGTVDAPGAKLISQGEPAILRVSPHSFVLYSMTREV